MAKKKKKKIAKRRVQKSMKKQKRKKVPKAQPENYFLEHTSISEMAPPDGFLPVSMSQAIMKYAEPIMKYVDWDDTDKLNQTFKVVLELWNFNLPDAAGFRELSKKEIIKHLRKELKISKQEAAELFDMMIERKKHLFPEDIQPDGTMTMFMRKEKSYEIEKFDYDSIKLSPTPYTPQEEDEHFVRLLNRMDDYILDKIFYDLWEEHYFFMVDKGKERFKNWLDFKGVEAFSKDFSASIDIYLDFIYRYEHRNDVTLKSVKPVHIEDFFSDFILRKLVAEPDEYMEYMPALKLFYMFLSEIGYLDHAEKIVKYFDEIEPQFIEILERMFG